MHSPVAGFFIFLWLPTAEADDCEWMTIPGGQAYIKLNTGKKTWIEALEFCRHYSGQLMVLNSTVNKANAWKAEMNSTHISQIHSEITKNGTYTIWDGIKPGQVGDFECHKIEWSLEGKKWIEASCNSSLPFLCEARVPCYSHPTVIIDGLPWIGNRTFAIQEHDNVEIRCITIGYAERVAGVALECDGTSYGKSAALDFTRSLLNKTCVCTSTLHDGSQEFSEVVLNITFPPTFSPGYKPRKTYKAILDDKIYVLLRMVANPLPRYFSLWRDDEEVQDMIFQFSTVVIPGKALPTIQLTLTIEVLGYSQEGAYVVLVENKFGSGLNWTFYLEMMPTTGKAYNISGIPALTVMIVLAVIGLVTSGSFTIVQKRLRSFEDKPIVNSQIKRETNTDGNEEKARQPSKRRSSTHATVKFADDLEIFEVPDKDDDSTYIIEDPVRSDKLQGKVNVPSINELSNEHTPDTSPNISFKLIRPSVISFQ